MLVHYVGNQVSVPLAGDWYCRTAGHVRSTLYLPRLLTTNATYLCNLIADHVTHDHVTYDSNQPNLITCHGNAMTHGLSRQTGVATFASYEHALTQSSHHGHQRW